MHNLLSQLIIYRSLSESVILEGMSNACDEVAIGDYERDYLVQDIYRSINSLLKVATEYGFDKNLWQNYLTYLLISSETPFSITCEKVGACAGSVNKLAKHDFAIIRQLFHYDFSQLEK